MRKGPVRRGSVARGCFLAALALLMLPFAVIGLVVVLGSFRGRGGPDAAPAPPPSAPPPAPDRTLSEPAPPVGSIAELNRPGGAGNVLLADDRSLVPALSERSEGAFGRFVALREEGRVTYLPNGTRAMVIGGNAGALRVRILGEHQAGSVWWVESRYARADAPVVIDRPVFTVRAGGYAEVIGEGTGGFALPEGTMVEVLEIDDVRVKVKARWPDEVAGRTGELPRQAVRWTPWVPGPPRPERTQLDELKDDDFGRRVEAEAREQQAEEARRARAESLYRMAESLRRQGKARGALDFYRRMVKEYPGTPQAADAAARVKELGGSR